MAGHDDSSLNRFESDVPSESNKTSEVVRGDEVETLKQRVELLQSEETHAKVKVFTFGDGGFGIDGLSESDSKAQADTTARGEAEQPDKEFKPVEEKDPSEYYQDVDQPNVHYVDIDYHGESVKQVVKPIFGAFEKDTDTLESIARKHLGEGASEEDVRKHVDEIKRLNGIKDPSQIKDGQVLLVPGHDELGGFLVVDEYGNSYRHGALSIDVKFANGSTFTRTMFEEGGYLEDVFDEHHPDDPAYNFFIRKTPDGRYLIGDNAGDIPPIPETPDDPGVHDARAKLDQLAQEKIRNPQELERFHADMARLEKRAANAHPPLGPEEIAETYKAIAKLFEAKGDKPLPEDQRIHVAEQIMAHAGTPTSIDQGDHATCNVATVESAIFTKNPSAAANLIAEVATTGSYTTRGTPPTTVTIEDYNLIPYSEERRNPTADGQRSHASQIFQVAAVNIGWKNHGYTYTDSAGNTKHVTPGQVVYDQGPPTSGNPPTTGEALRDHSVDPPEIIRDQNGKPILRPKLEDDWIIEISNQITGPKCEAVMFGYKGFVVGAGEKVTTFESEAQLEEKLASLKPEDFPIIFGVDTTNEPFWTDSGGGLAGGSGGPHVVTITGYEQGPPAVVHMDNEWGRKLDHPVSVHDLFLASLPTSETLPRLKPEDAEGRIDPIIAFEQVRLKLRHGKAGDQDDYEEELLGIVEKINSQWHEEKLNETIDQKKYDEAIHALALTIKKTIDADRQEAFLNRLPQDVRAFVVEDNIRSEAEILDKKSRQQKDDGAFDEAKYKDGIHKLAEEIAKDIYPFRKEAFLDTLPPDVRAAVEEELATRAN